MAEREDFVARPDQARAVEVEDIQEEDDDSEDDGNRLGSEAAADLSTRGASYQRSAYGGDAGRQELVFGSPFESSAPHNSSPEAATGRGPHQVGGSPQNAQRLAATFGTWLDQNFRTLDANNDGAIEKREIESRILDPNFATGNNAIQLAALHTHHEAIAQVFSGKPEAPTPQYQPAPDGDEPAEPAAVLTRDAVTRFNATAQDREFLSRNSRELRMSDLADTLDNFQSREDAGWGSLFTPAELNAALQRTDLTDRQRAGLTDLRAHMDHLRTKKYEHTQNYNGEESVSDDGVTWSSRDRAAMLDPGQIRRLASIESRVVSGVAESVERANFRTAESARPENRDRIAQGVDGSCFFLAPLISMQNQDRAAVDRLIRDNGNGTHTVTFPGAPDHPITVNNPTQAEMINWASGQRAAIFEKAFGEYYSRHMRDQPRVDGGTGPTESQIPAARIAGGRTEDAMRLLTGRETVATELESQTDDQVRAELQRASEGHLPVSADTRQWHNSAGLVRSHSYAARYDAATDTVTLENPTKPSGRNANTPGYPYEPHRANGAPLDGQDDGVFRMSVADFRRNFLRISVPR